MTEGQVRPPLAADTTPFVGREAELAALRDRFADAAAGRGSLLLVSGEPGIGKTRLVSELAESEPDGVRVVWGRCWDSGGAPSMWPWTAVLRELVAGRDPQALRQQLGAGARWLTQLVPELTEALPELRTEPPADSEQSRFVLFDSMARFLHHVSAEQPLAIVLDDIHAADQLSLLALLFLAPVLADMHVLVVATYREAETEHTAQVAELFARLSRAGGRIALSGLEADDLGRLVEHRTAGAVDAAAVRALHRATSGNPFFADEMVRMLVSAGRIDALGERGGAHLPPPMGVRALIEQRLEALPAASVAALRGASVIGSSFSVATLTQATGGSQGELLEALAPALDAQLISPSEEVAGFRFAHDLINETVYASIGAPERARIHEAIGHALVRRYAGATDAHIEEVAHHFLQALPTGDARLAVEYAERAAAHAQNVFAHERAAGLYSNALDALDLIDQLSDVERAYWRAGLLLGLGRARQRIADPSTRATLQEAADVARAAGATAVLADVALAFGAFGLSPGRVDEQLTALLDEILEQIGPEDSTLRAELLAGYARAIYWSGDDGRREELIDEALGVARRLGDRGVLAAVLGNCVQGGRGPGTSKRDLQWIDEFMSLPSPPGELVVVARSVEIDLLLERGILTAADAAIDALESQAERLRDTRARPYVPMHRARRAMMEGRWADAERQIEAAAAIAADLDDSTFPLTIGGGRFILELTRGRPELLEDGLRTLALTIPNMPVWQAGLALIAAHRGDEAEARLVLDRYVSPGLAGIPRDVMWSITLAVLAQACAIVGDVDQARVLYDAMLPFEPFTVISPLSGYLGPVARQLGLLAAALGDDEAAERHLRGALELARRQRTAPMIATVLVDLATVLARGASAAEAGVLVEEAGRLANELGIAVVAERAEAIGSALASAGGVVAVNAVGGSRADAEENARLALEGEVWSFSFDGRTVRIRDGRGVRHLAALLAAPGVEQHALTLTGGPGVRAGPAANAAVAAGELSAADAGAGAGPALDATAKSAYRRRLGDLREELDEAERFNDPERAARAREEIEFLARELAGAVGLGGRDRPQHADAERARVNVTRAIKGVIRRLAQTDPGLGAELTATVRTGLFCSYEPDPRRPVRWHIGGA